MTGNPAYRPAPFFPRIPVLLLCLAFLTLFSAPEARAQGNYTLTYVTYPGDYLYDVSRRLETNPAVVRWLNPGKIGPGGRLEPYTRLLIPTTRANRGRVIGAKPPQGLKPTPRTPFKKPIVAATPQSTPPAAPPRTTKPIVPPAEEPVTYDTRPAPTEYKQDVGPGQYARLVIASVFVIGCLLAFQSYVRRKRQTAPPAVPAETQTPSPKPDVPAAAVPAEDLSFGAHLDAASQARELPEEPPDESPAEISSPALLEPEEKTDTLNRVEAAEPDPVALEKSLTDTQEMEPPDFSNYVDDDIPQTSLADALRGRRKHP